MSEDQNEKSQVNFVLPEGLELDEPLGGEIETVPGILDESELNISSAPPEGLTEEAPPIILLDADCKVDIDLGDLSTVSLDRRNRKRFGYSGAVLLTDKASHRRFHAQSRDLHKEGVGLAFSGPPPKEGDQLILEFVGDERLQPLSLEVVVTSVNKRSDDNFTFVGLKVVYAGSLAKKRIEEYIDSLDD